MYVVGRGRDWVESSQTSVKTALIQNLAGVAPEIEANKAKTGELYAPRGFPTGLYNRAL